MISGQIATEPMLSGAALALGVLAVIGAAVLMWLCNAIYLRIAKHVRRNFRRDIGFMDRAYRNYPAQDAKQRTQQ